MQFDSILFKRLWKLNGFEVHLTRYAAGGRMGWHVDRTPRLTLILAGGVREETRLSEHRGAIGDMVSKPNNIEHCDEVGPDGMTTFSIVGGSGAPKTKCFDARGDMCYGWLNGVSLRAELLRACWNLAASTTPTKPRFTPSAIGNALRIYRDTRSRIAPRASSRQPAWLQQVEEHVDSETDPPSVRELAEQAGVHPVYLTRVFRTARGRSIREHFQATRVARAAEMLTRDDGSIAATAMRAGFADQPHLCRSFKAHFGVTPGEYQKLTKRIAAALR